MQRSAMLLARGRQSLLAPSRNASSSKAPTVHIRRGIYITARSSGRYSNRCPRVLYVWTRYWLCKLERHACGPCVRSRGPHCQCQRDNHIHRTNIFMCVKFLENSVNQCVPLLFQVHEWKRRFTDCEFLFSELNFDNEIVSTVSADGVKQARTRHA